MPRRVLLAAIAATVLACAALSASASAAVFCVHHPEDACPVTPDPLLDFPTTSGSTLASALALANGTNAGHHDTVYIGPGNWSSPTGFKFDDVYDLDVFGAGRGQTTLTATGGRLGLLGPVVHGGTLKVSGLTLVGPDLSTLIDTATLEDVSVSGTDAAGPVVTGSNATLRHVSVTGPGDGAALDGNSTVEDSSLSAPGTALTLTGNSANVKRTKLTA